MQNVAICENNSMKQATQEVKMPSGESTRREVPLTDIAWLGGFITGEGCLGAYLVHERRSDRPDLDGRLAFRVSLVLAGSKIEDLLKAKSILDNLGCKAHMTQAKRKDRKFWVGSLYVGGQGTLKKLLPLLLPFLSSKRAEAECLLQIIAYRESIIFAGKGGHDANADPQLVEMINHLKTLKDEGKTEEPLNDYTPRSINEGRLSLELAEKRRKLFKFLKTASPEQAANIVEALCRVDG